MSFWKRAAFQCLGVAAGLVLSLQIYFVAARWWRDRPLMKEADLHSDLSVMREAIQQYTLDKQAAPQSLEDLVPYGYLREVPIDPVTQHKDWEIQTSDDGKGGITGVHSASRSVSPFEKTPYNTW